MKDSRLEKLAPLTGVVMVVLMAIGAALLGIYDYLPTADRLKEILSDNATNVFAGGYIGSISAFFMIWFTGSVFSALREREGGTGRLSMVAFGGGVASGVALAVGFSAILASGARAGTESGITPVEAVTMYDIYGQVLGGVFAIAMAVFIGATAVVSLRTLMFPKWFGWVSALIAFGLLTPFAYAVLALVLVWLLVLSIWLYRRGTSPA
ncbi:MAG: hypothetical protein BMS9Abin28_0026 [Anaerolineae bacterium]|nr:MAG: hypothetical protein BMS9Abin28_0026 [Anaerolineae bacterium]